MTGSGLSTGSDREEARSMLYAGLDLSRKRLDFHLLDGEGATVEVGAAPPDADGLRGLSGSSRVIGEPICAAIESMNGARFVHDQLELHGWEVEIADAAEGEGAGPVGLQDRPDRRLGAGRALAPRPGAGDLAARPARCGRSASVPAGACTSSATAPASSSACTRRCSRTASPARSPTCSASAAASCSPASRCRSRGGRTSRRACA